MTRPQVPAISSPDRISGVAAPVNTYVRPPDPPRSSLHDLADGLAAFDSGLTGFMDKRKAEDRAAQEGKAIADFYRNNQAGYAEATRQGLIPATANPFYVKAYKGQQGQIAGLKLADQYSIDYQQWEGRNGGDPNAYAAWHSKWMASNVGNEQDPDVLAGLAPSLERITVNGYDTFNKERDARLKAGATSNVGALVTDAARKNVDANNASGGTDYSSLWNNYLRIREDGIKSGMLAESLDTEFARAAIEQAEQSNDVDVLTVLDRTLPGKDKPMSYDPAIAEAQRRAKENIQSRLATTATKEAVLQERKDKEAHNVLMGQAVSALASGQDVPESAIKELTRRDGEARYKLAQIKQTFENNNEQEDQSALLHVYASVDAGDTGVIQRALDAGIIRKASTYSTLMDRSKSVQDAYGNGGVFTGATFKNYENIIKTRTAESDITDYLAKVGTVSQQGIEALFSYRSMMLDWSAKNPKASIMEKEEAAKKAGDIIMSRIGPGDAGAGTYYPNGVPAQPDPMPEDQPGPAPQKPQREQGVLPWLRNFITGGGSTSATPSTPAAPQGAPQAPAPAAPTPTQPQAKAPGLDSLSPDQRQAVETLAKRKGWTPEYAHQLIWQQQQKANIPVENTTPPAGQGTATPPLEKRSDITPEVRTKLVGLFKDQPKATQLAASNVPVAPLLSLIGGAEGTDKGAGYNETLSYGAFTGGPVNLTGMTLGEIDQLQGKMLAHPGNSMNSSAVGRYQIIRTTLRSLKQRMGLSDDTKFTPELQDQLALQLLKGRGLDQWQAGTMSDEQFMAGLSAEWASLPRADGTATYNQRLGAKTKKVKDALSATKVASSD
ncbi:hypothetical protein [Ancylobacter amanitiformis]|uniref:Lysozyme n=1 Tax=Ancylobacter amanitiformis TaxID=217069 RepID=A0ABU0LSJ1_9HYPH|nr:hypothetical protein [Ancylobacter amanitiformis]MDQ0511667.1 hypothetical protein [Ancylobacter amanitiformis]